MARAQIKLLLFLITLGIVGACMATVFWLYQNVLVKERKTMETIKEMSAPGRPPPDPGARRFDAAMDLVKAGKLAEAREGLYRMLQQFPKSATCPDAKRIIGEMNMDALCSLDASGGKKDYVVQPRDALLNIASRNHTTIEAIARFNSLTSFNLQPGEHLFLIPMDFDMVVNVSTKKVTLLHEGQFFKEYEALKVALPPGTKVPSEMSIGNKSAMNSGKLVSPVSADFAKADKTIVAYKNAVTVGLIIQAPPLPPPVGETTSTTPLPTAKSKPPAAPKPKAKSKGKGKSKGSSQAEPDGDNDQPRSTLQTGVILANEDLEEIYPILHKDSKLRLVH